MTLEQFWAVLIKRWPIILICLLVIGTGTYVKTRMTTPTYQSSSLVQVAVGSGSTDINDQLANNQLVQTEVILATTEPVLRNVASHHEGLTVDQLVSKVTVTAKTNAQIFEITVQDQNPARAASIANDIAKVLIEQQTKQQQQAVRHDKADKGTNFLFLVQSAQPALRPAQPNILLNTGFGFLAGLLVGLLLALIFDKIDLRIRTMGELFQLTAWPIFVAIGRSGSSRDDVLLSPLGKSMNIETYRMLRTKVSLVAAKAHTPVRLIMVTSPTEQEGKSTVAANLAISMAKAGRNTILIDANLRQPTLYEKFNVPTDKAGLSNAIVAFSQPMFVSSPAISLQPGSQLPANDVLRPYLHNVGIANLRLVPSGPLPPNPPELLASRAMDTLMKALKNSEAEIIIFDTRALLGLSDTSILASKVDGAIVVVDITRAEKKSLLHTHQALQQIDTPVLGCVINRSRRKQENELYFNDEERKVEARYAQHGYVSPAPLPPSNVPPSNGQHVHSS